MWGCLQEAPAHDDEPATQLERHVRSARAALAVVERRLAETPGGSVADVLGTWRRLRAVLDAVDRRALRNVSIAVEHLEAEMRGLAAALALVRRLRSAAAPAASAPPEPRAAS